MPQLGRLARHRRAGRGGQDKSGNGAEETLTGQACPAKAAALPLHLKPTGGHGDAVSLEKLRLGGATVKIFLKAGEEVADFFGFAEVNGGAGTELRKSVGNRMGTEAVRIGAMRGC